jgi:hypothetical protein
MKEENTMRTFCKRFYVVAMAGLGICTTMNSSIQAQARSQAHSGSPTHNQATSRRSVSASHSRSPAYNQTTSRRHFSTAHSQSPAHNQAKQSRSNHFEEKTRRQAGNAPWGSGSQDFLYWLMPPVIQNNDSVDPFGGIQRGIGIQWKPPDPITPPPRRILPWYQWKP